MIGDFHTGPQKKGERTWQEAHDAMDASLEEALVAHREWAAKTEGDKYGDGVGVGMEPNITFGHARREACSDYCVCSKLELGTWAERLSEMCIEIEQSQTFENVREKVQGIARWWEMCGDYMKNHSSPLGETALRIVEEQQKTGVFPEGMTVDWALDVQSAQTLDFLAALKANSYAKKMVAVPPPPQASMEIDCEVDTGLVMTRQTSEAIKMSGKMMGSMGKKFPQGSD